ncbi:hypothetical protein [Zavarzinella formosa]|uniref:hypothetical protein n=1 Tax=Zavarzinella formosa TaxID=360055 RepID=UPI0012F71D1E|nr:hypothetical protein [Zavarzinella formosa]
MRIDLLARGRVSANEVAVDGPPMLVPENATRTEPFRDRSGGVVTGHQQSVRKVESGHLMSKIFLGEADPGSEGFFDRLFILAAMGFCEFMRIFGRHDPMTIEPRLHPPPFHQR